MYGINQAQKDSLATFIGEEGIYSETIKDDTSIDLGTKILYLERAIKQTCAGFNRSLDKLYMPDINNKQAHNDLIRSLKIINDLCFNNEIKNGQFGTSNALVHYFGGLGQIDLESEIQFQIEIKKIIKASIVALSQGQTKETIQNQKQVRTQAEGAIQPKTGWREELDLPSAQIVVSPAAPVLVPQFNSLQSQPRPTVVPNSLSGVIAAEQRATMPVQIQARFIQNQEYVPQFIQSGATIEVLQSMSQAHFTALRHFDVTRLMTNHNVTFEQVKGLYDESMDKLKTIASSDVRILMEYHNITFEQVNAWYDESPDKLQTIVSSDVRLFIINRHITLDQAKALYDVSPDKLKLVVSYGVRMLIEKHSVTFEQVNALYDVSPETLKRIASHEIRSLPPAQFREQLMQALPAQQSRGFLSRLFRP